MFLRSDFWHGRERVVIEGYARDGHVAPVLVTDDGARYFIDGMQWWPKGLSGSRVQVTGKLVTTDKFRAPEGGSGTTGSDKLLVDVEIREMHDGAVE